MITNFFKKKYSYILLNFLFTAILHSQQFKNYNNENLIKQPIHPDSIFSTLTFHHKSAVNTKDTINIIKSLISLSAYNRKKLNYSIALENSGEALFIAEKFKDTLLIAKTHEEFGVLNYLFKQDLLAEKNFKKSHSYFLQLSKHNKLPLKDLYSSYYNLALYYQRTENIKLLEAAIDSCFSINKRASLDLINNAYLNEKRASIFKWQQKPHKAINLLEKSIDAINALPQESISRKKHHNFLIILYASSACMYYSLNEMELAKSYFEKSLHIEDTSGEHTFYRAYVYLKYSELLFDLGDYKNAYKNLTLSKNINYTYLNPRNESTQGFITIKNSYKNQLMNQNLELAHKTQKILRFRIFISILLIIMVFLGFILRSRIRTLKYQKKERSSNELLDIKNTELTTNTLQLIEKEEIIKTLRDYIKKINSDVTTKSFLKSLEKQSISLWDSFNNRFTTQNKEFYELLQKKVPDLSTTDLKICALLKLNFSSKEMAHLLGISLGSVHVARHRVRKKMNISREQNLMTYINTITSHSRNK